MLIFLVQYSHVAVIVLFFIKLIKMNTKEIYLIVNINMSSSNVF